MPSLPLGAAHQHPLDTALLDYEHIVSIEYIEIAVLSIYPRSAAYQPSADGAKLRVRELNEPDIVDRDLSVDQAHAYIERLVKSGVFSWQRVYRPVQGTFTNESTNWRLEICFRSSVDGVQARPFRVEGENSFPDNYELCVAALMDATPTK